MNPKVQLEVSFYILDSNQRSAIGLALLIAFYPTRGSITIHRGIVGNFSQIRSYSTGKTDPIITYVRGIEVPSSKPLHKSSINLSSLNQLEIGDILHDLVILKILSPSSLNSYSISKFIDSRLIFKLGAVTPVTDLHDAYIDYCLINQFTPLKLVAFSTQLRKTISLNSNFTGAFFIKKSVAVGMNISL